ncbi:MAG: hypothetical protein L7S42_03570, partial [Flavobacteriaceae bacterium]|nr:hypothetical protein [Flavobacteriaceae bacterium]
MDSYLKGSAEEISGKFLTLKKDDLLALAQHFEITEIKKSMRKSAIQKILVQYLEENEIIEEE